jgi:hypothetical protein
MDEQEQYDIALIGAGAGDDERAVFTCDESNPVCRLTCTYRGKTIAAEAGDFFEALCRVRRQLEPEGLIPFCYGASLNVYPSAMARDMGLGFKAYRMTKGVHARGSHLVEIFDTGPDVIPASVEAQEAFFLEWLATPRV